MNKIHLATVLVPPQEMTVYTGIYTNHFNHATSFWEVQWDKLRLIQLIATQSSDVGKEMYITHSYWELSGIVVK